MKFFRIKGVDKLFPSSAEAYEWLMEHEEELGLSVEDVEEVPDYDIEAFCKSHPEDPKCKAYKEKIHQEMGIEESPEENPDEDSVIKPSPIGKKETEVIDEKTLIEKLAVKKALETFGEWDETAKAEIIQQGLNITDKTRPDKPARLKGAPKHSTIESYVIDQYQKIVETLADEDSTACPICNRPYEEGLTKEELDFWKPDLHPSPENPPKFTRQSKKKDPKLPKVLESQFPSIHLIHCRMKHPAVFQLLKILFKVPKEMPHVAEPYSSNPESCSDLENLSKEELEELTEDIASKPELRNLLFKKWKESRKSN